MKKLHSFTVLAFVAPILALTAGSAFAQNINHDNDRLQPEVQLAFNVTQSKRNYGQNMAEHDRSYLDSVPVNGSYANTLIGTDVYTKDNEDIGKVNDLVIDRNAQVVAILVSVGGFLGIGQKNVAIGWDNLTLTGTKDDQKLRADVTRQELDAAPKFVNRERNAKRGSQRHGEVANMRTESHLDDTGENTRRYNRGHIDALPSNGSHASKLMGADVRTADNENIGSAEDLVIDRNGRIVAVIVSVGGFIGMGQKNVAIGWDKITRSGPADKQELRANVTREELLAAPKFASRGHK